MSSGWVGSLWSVELVLTVGLGAFLAQDPFKILIPPSLREPLCGGMGGRV